MNEQRSSADYLQNPWLQTEGMGDDTLLNLLRRREELFDIGIAQRDSENGIMSPEVEAEQAATSAAITKRTTKLTELKQQAGDNEDFYHALIKEDDLREACEENPEDLVLREKWYDARFTVRQFRDDLELPPDEINS